MDRWGGLVRGVSGGDAPFTTLMGGDEIWQMKSAASGGVCLLAVFVGGVNQFLTLS
jgi:hypothetical protein